MTARDSGVVKMTVNAIDLVTVYFLIIIVFSPENNQLNNSAPYELTAHNSINKSY